MVWHKGPEAKYARNTTKKNCMAIRLRWELASVPVLENKHKKAIKHDNR